uniref:CSON005915 protein n=1 Tax=Culicoides sonorensis TaxID=179676 RepID=A0A336L6Y7_CULSO
MMMVKENQFTANKEKWTKYLLQSWNIDWNRVPDSETVKLELIDGILIGSEKKLPLNGSYFAFQGIPYAEPPIGELRFKEPVPITSFNGKTLDCTKEGDISIQSDIFSKNVIGEESCLFLNVYTPYLDKTRKLPVMIYIHGGAFIFGSGNVAEHSPEYLVQEDVIVVTFNYRLNVLGFMHLPSVGIIGNQGFRDQRLVFKWVQENIEKFGGDPNNVTLFGHSAGAAAVHLHMMLPGSKKYFHKAILQSGAATMDWFMQFEPEENARRIAKLLGCESTDDSEIGKFLKEIDGKKFPPKYYDTLTTTRKKRGLPLIFNTVIEDENQEIKPFLTKSIDQYLTTPNQIDIPIMMGVTEHDGMVMTTPHMKRYHLWNKEPGRFIPRTVNVDGDIDEGECKVLGDEIKQFYFGDKPVSQSTFNQFMDFQTDYHFSIALQSAAEFHSRYQNPSTNLYYYQFSFDGDLNMMKKILGYDMKGANHGDELTYLFVMKMAEIKVPEDSEAGIMRRKMCRMWANFAKVGNPTPENNECDLLGNLKWNPVKSYQNAENEEFQLNCLDINTDCKMIQDPFKKRMDFWRKEKMSSMNLHDDSKFVSFGKWTSIFVIFISTAYASMKLALGHLTALKRRDFHRNTILITNGQSSISRKIGEKFERDLDCKVVYLPKNDLISRQKTHETVLEDAFKVYKSIDVIINNDHAFLSNSQDEACFELDEGENLINNLNILRYCIPKMYLTGGGHIISIKSNENSFRALVNTRNDLRSYIQDLISILNGNERRIKPEFSLQTIHCDRSWSSVMSENEIVNKIFDGILSQQPVLTLGNGFFSYIKRLMSYFNGYGCTSVHVL